MTLIDTKIDILTCTACELSSQCNSPIPVHHPPYPRYIVVGEAPGSIEDIKGLPFVGPAGLFLKRTLRKVGLRPSDGAFMNAVSCFPKQQRTPTQQQITACKRNLFRQLDGLDPSPTLVVGAVALSALLPNALLAYAIGGPIRAHGKQLFPVYHPSYILRNRSREVYALWERHLCEFANMVNGQYVSRDILQIHNCLYCAGARMSDKDVCIRHEGVYEKDKMRPVFRLPKPPQLSLFDE